MLYKFMGKPDHIFPQLITGEVYNLDVYRCGHAPNAGKIMAFGTCFKKEGIGSCPYNTWQAFFRNWLPFYEKWTKCIFPTQH